MYLNTIKAIDDNNKILIHGDMFICDLKMLKRILEPFKLTTNRYTNDDGSMTVSVKELGLEVWGRDKVRLFNNLANEIVRESKYYYVNATVGSYLEKYNEIVPYVLKVLLCEDEKEVLETCL